jgi:hypothetical protein
MLKRIFVVVTLSAVPARSSHWLLRLFASFAAQRGGCSTGRLWHRGRHSPAESPLRPRRRNGRPTAPAVAEQWGVASMGGNGGGGGCGGVC